jgi:hypothetical protein
MASKIDRQALADVKRYARMVLDARTGPEIEKAAKKAFLAAARVRKSA